MSDARQKRNGESNVEDPRVFLSYSRRDAGAAEWLRLALREQGFDAYLDVHDIAPGEAWQDRLHNLISTAEKIVFLISPDAVASEICAWEVDCAEQLGKTILPVVLRETQDDSIPKRLGRLNFVFMRDDKERSKNLNALVEALSLDLSWEREKARITDDALAWDRAGRPNRLLLFSNDAIRAAEAWRDTRPVQAPALTEMQIAFIDSSRVRRSTIQRRVAVVSVCVAVITAIAAVFAVIQRQRAIESEQVATTRAAILSASTAGDMSEDGAIDEALLLLLEASKSFSPDTVPDALLIGFDRALRSASGKRRYSLPSTTQGFSVPGGMLLHDTASGAVSFFDGRVGPRPVGSLPGEILAVEETTATDGLLAVVQDHSHLTIAFVDYEQRDIGEIGQISGFYDDPTSYVQISSSGIVFANSPNLETPSAIVFDSRSGEAAHFDGALSDYGDISTDGAGKTYLLPAFDLQRFPILEVNEELELTPIETDQDRFARLRFDRCVGVAVSDPDVMAAREALNSDELERTFVWTGSSMRGLASSFGDMTCERSGQTVMIHLNVLNNRVSVRQTTLVELETGRPKFRYLNRTAKSSNIAAFWKKEDDTYDWPVYGIADPEFSDIRIFDMTADDSFPREPESVIGESAVIEALVSPQAERLLVLRAAGRPTEQSNVDLRLAVYDLNQLQSYGSTDYSSEYRDMDQFRPNIAPLRPKICTKFESEEPVDEIDVPVGSVRIGRSETTDRGFLEFLDQNRAVLAKIDLDWSTVTSDVVCAGLTHARDRLFVKDGDGYLVLSTSPKSEGEVAFQPLAPGYVSSIAFFASGPSLITTDANSGNVTIWNPSNAADTGWEQRTIYSGRNQVLDAQSDASGKRLLIVESPDGPFRRGFVYSLEAHRTWREIGRGFRFLNVDFLADGSVYSEGLGAYVNQLHSLQEAVDAAKDAINPECTPDNPDAWTTSPCWPSGL